MMVEQLAFRTGSIGNLRDLQKALSNSGVEGVLQICHGNAWSLYFADIEGNGVECFVESPFHVAQPFAQGLDLSKSDDEILVATREMVADDPELQPLEEWKTEFSQRLRGFGADS